MTECKHGIPNWLEDCEECRKENDSALLQQRVRHPLPQIVIDKFDDYEAALVARDEVLKSIFKFQYKKAVYYGRIAEQCRRKFWVMVQETYPEIGTQLTYHKQEGSVSETEKGG